MDRYIVTHSVTFYFCMVVLYMVRVQKYCLKNGAPMGKFAGGYGRYHPKNEPRPNVSVRTGCLENGSYREICPGMKLVRPKERTFMRSCIRGKIMYIKLVSGYRAQGIFRPKFPSLLKEIVRNFGPEHGSTRKPSGGTGGATHKF